MLPTITLIGTFYRDARLAMMDRQIDCDPLAPVHEVKQSWWFEHFEPREFIAQRDKVVVNVFERARYKATGRAVDNDYVHIYTVRDGKITALRIFEDTAPLLAGMRSA